MIGCLIADSFTELTNNEFGQLVVVGLKNVGSYYAEDLWLCHCRCRRFPMPLVIPGQELRNGKMRCCGCTRLSERKFNQKPPPSSNQALSSTVYSSR